MGTRPNKRRGTPASGLKGTAPPNLEPPAAKTPEDDPDAKSVGELVRQYEEERTARGPYTEEAQRLRRAIDKAMEQEAIHLGMSEELALMERSIRRRLPLTYRARVRACEQVEAALDDPEVENRLRAGRLVALFERINQMDEHHDSGDGGNGGSAKGTIVNVNINTESPQQRRNRFLDVAAELGIETAVIEVQPERTGQHPEAVNGASHAGGIGQGEGNGHAGGFCSGDQRREMENGQAPGHSEPGTNGNSDRENEAPDR